MVKATRRSAVLLGLAALGLLGSSIPAFAEVQNVKVGGDVTVRSFFRSNLDLHQSSIDPSDTDLNSHENFLMTTTGLNVAADLTENISAVLRLANERDWNAPTAAGGDVAISQSYVKIRDLFYSPLTVTIGRQPIVWGRGFVLGSGLLPNVVNRGDDVHASITANEFTDFTAFDAIRGTVDLQGKGAIDLPLTLDVVYIKINENAIGSADDVNLLGVNVGSKIAAADSEVEAYYLNKRDRSSGTSTNDNFGSVSTIGVRGSSAPIEGSSIYAELAYQFGKRATDFSGVLAAGDAQQAWGFDLGAEYTAKDVPTSPKIGAEWIFFSGKDVDGAVGGWDPIARGYFTTALREFSTASSVTGFYPVDQTCFSNGTAANACTGSTTNQHQLSIYGSLKPLEDLTISPRLSWFVLDKGAIPVAGSKRRSFAGTEWDTVMTYDYTDDVQFGVIYALFAPGNTFRHPRDNPAQELITSIGVKF